VSRVPRVKEHLKTGFMAEAASAARYRANARRAAEAGLERVAERWRDLAAAKDDLAILQLEAGGLVKDPARSVAEALSEERFENDVLYPKMIRDVDEDSAAVFRQVVEAQTEQAGQLEELRRDLQAASGDIG